MAFHITSPISQSARRRINRAAKANLELQPTDPRAFLREGCNTYAPLWPDVDDHSIARHLMALAGQVFQYEVTHPNREEWEQWLGEEWQQFAKEIA